MTRHGQRVFHGLMIAVALYAGGWSGIDPRFEALFRWASLLLTIPVILYAARPFFGDTHLHTSWSTDSGMAGGTLGPDVAYRVSRGETVTSKLGWQVKLIRPLDFVVVADHAENLGLAPMIAVAR